MLSALSVHELISFNLPNCQIKYHFIKVSTILYNVCVLKFPTMLHDSFSQLMQVSSLYSGEQIVRIQQHKLVECTDPNGNTPVSEAAAGGDPDTIR